MHPRHSTAGGLRRILDHAEAPLGRNTYPSRYARLWRQRTGGDRYDHRCAGQLAGTALRMKLKLGRPVAVTRRPYFVRVGSFSASSRQDPYASITFANDLPSNGTGSLVHLTISY